MYAFKKIMVALDLTAMDQYLLNYLEGLSKFVKAEKIYFVNIQKDLDIDAETKSLMGIDNNVALDEHAVSMMQETVKNHFPSNGQFDCEFDVAEGNPSTEILRWPKMKNSDLVIMGRKKKLKGEGIAPQQIASKINCSILLIPEGYKKFKLKKVFVPVNFTKQTNLALEEAITIQDKTPQTLDIYCHHYYELPLGFEKSGKTDEEFCEIMDRNARKKFIQMKHDLSIKTAEFNYTDELLKDGNIAKELVKKAEEYKADLIIMAAKSKTLAAQLFLGNTTKKMIMNIKKTPLLIVKNKNETFDFWDFFSKI
jgi:nucleotide-binding universal stress UspA family protein